MAEVFGSVGLAECDKKLRNSVKAYSFVCKCGSDLFRVDTEIFADHSFLHVIWCVACGQVCVPTEPVTNGPH